MATDPGDCDRLFAEYVNAGDLEIEFLDTIPKTASGKTKRFLLRQGVNAPG